MRVSALKEKDLTPQLVDRLLFEGLHDTGESADCAIVLGSAKAARYRLPAAAAAYKAGRVPKILLCGGVERAFPEGVMTEAEHMRRAALAAGVAPEDILMEESSLNTVENILCSLMEMQRALWLNNVHRVLLVTTAYHMRRSLAIARYLFPQHIEIIPCPCEDTHTRRSNWMDSPAGVARAHSEAMNLAKYVNNGVFPDFEI